MYQKWPEEGSVNFICPHSTKCYRLGRGAYHNGGVSGAMELARVDCYCAAGALPGAV